MLILDYPDWDTPTLFEAFYPKMFLELTPELAIIDELLNNPIFETPIIERYQTKFGRPTVPVRAYIRLMVLKFYLRISFEDLVVTVGKTPMYKRFCRIPMEKEVPSDTALMKITKKYGDVIVHQLNDNLIEQLLKDKVIKGRKLRIDTTVVEANIEYPTDAELLYKGVEKLDRVIHETKERCGNTANKRSKKKIKKMRKQLLSISKVIRRRTEQMRTEVRNITGEMAETAKSISKETLKYAQTLVAENTGDQKAINKLHSTAQLLNTVIEQTETVNRGETPTNRIVSIDDPSARPISKGKLGKRVEFGYKLQIQEIAEGIITDYGVFKGNPSDTKLITQAVESHIQKFHRAPRELAADRGYYSSENERILSELGVKHISIPKPGKKSVKRSVYESSNKFKKLQSFRAGVEGRISCIKRRFGLRRSMLRGLKGTSTWCGFGILTHNLRKASQLMLG